MGAALGCECLLPNSFGYAEKRRTQTALGYYRERIEELEQALRVIRTWAAVEIDGHQGALVAGHVVDLCDKRLKAKTQDQSSEVNNND